MRPGKLAGPGIILLAALAAIVPQLVRGNSCGHDFDVHLVSWLDCVNAWKHGLFYPHWTPGANYGAGEPRFVFYPPLTWMAGAALGLVFPWWVVPIALTFLILAGTGLATRALALEACCDAVATLAGCAAIFSGFALFTAYERSAFPEFMGGVWLPLLLKYALRDYSLHDRSRANPLLGHALDGSAAPLTLVLAAAWLSNAPLGVIASYLLAAVALLAAVLRKSWAPVVRASVAAALGMGTIAVYLLPAAFERAWVDIRTAYRDPGYNFENNWAFARHADPALALHDVVLRQASVIGVTMIAVALACLAVCWRRGVFAAGKSSRSQRWWMALAPIPAIVLVLLFPVSRPLWRLLPEWRFVQYPWRWLEAVEAPMAIFFAAAIWPALRRWQWAAAGGCAALFTAAMLYTNAHFFTVCHPEDTVASTLNDYNSATGFEGMAEYQPPDSNHALIPMGLPAACLLTDPETKLGELDDDDNLVWNPGQKSCVATFGAASDPRSDPEHMRLHVVAPRAGYLVLRLLRYPAWRIVVNGRPLAAGRASAPTQRADGLTAFPVEAGQLTVTADWTTTPDVTASRWISLVCALLLAMLFTIERRWKQPSTNGDRNREPN
ncbi:MAG TPA: hypothetical protein VHX20_07255 [Terracidiphilus sp.]|nr:hypothetical protein [Terracidiphilus sp.]